MRVSIDPENYDVEERTVPARLVMFPGAARTPATAVEAVKRRVENETMIEESSVADPTECSTLAFITLLGQRKKSRDDGSSRGEIPAASVHILYRVRWPCQKMVGGPGH